MSDTMKIIAILDRSGSMQNMMEEMIGAFNAFVDEQRKEPGEAVLDLYIFDNIIERVHYNLSLQDVPHLTIEKAFARGSTSLNDAIGLAITSAGDYKDVMVLIQTDGYENSSKDFNILQIKELIAAKEAAGWEFTFTGAGIDAFSMGAGYGFTADKCLNVTKDLLGATEFLSVNSARTSAYRSSKM